MRTHSIFKKTVVPGKHIVYEKRLPNTVEGEWALGDMRGCCGCRLQTVGRTLDFQRRGSQPHPDVVQWEEAGGKSLSGSVWTYRGTRQEAQQGTVRTHHVSRKLCVAEASGGQESSALQTAFQLLPLKTKVPRAHIHSSFTGRTPAVLQLTLSKDEKEDEERGDGIELHRATCQLGW